MGILICGNCIAQTTVRSLIREASRGKAKCGDLWICEVHVYPESLSPFTHLNCEPTKNLSSLSGLWWIDSTMCVQVHALSVNLIDEIADLRTKEKLMLSCIHEQLSAGDLTPSRCTS